MLPLKQEFAFLGFPLIAIERIWGIIFLFIFFFFLLSFLASFLPSTLPYFYFLTKTFAMESQTVDSLSRNLSWLRCKRPFSELPSFSSRVVGSQHLTEHSTVKLQLGFNVTQRLSTVNLECQFYEFFCCIPCEFLNCPLGLPKKIKNKQKNIFQS